MNLGLLVAFRNPPSWRVPWADFYQQQLDLIVRAEELGFDTVWLTEHHFSEDGYSPSLMTIAAAIAARTQRIRIGTFLTLLPLHHPVRLAEDAATVDVISNGRLDLGVGLGYLPAELAAFGVERRERAGRLTEGIEVLRGLWTGEPFSYTGRDTRLEDVRLAPPPVQIPHPPLWVGAELPVGIRRAARLGCHYLSNGDPAQQQLYDDTLREDGHDPAVFHIAQLRWTHVAPTFDEAWDDCQDHLHYMLEMYHRWAVASGDKTGRERRELPSSQELRNSDVAQRAFIGSPDDVLDGIRSFTTNVRTTHLVLGMHLAGLAPARIARSMALFADVVMPALR